MFKGGLTGVMKKAQEMQEQMAKMREELGKQVVVGTAGAGAVNVQLTGHHQCVGVQLSDEALKEDKEMLEALLAAAVNDAVQKVEAMSQAQLGSLTGGLNLPAGFKLPF